MQWQQAPLFTALSFSLLSVPLFVFNSSAPPHHHRHYRQNWINVFSQAIYHGNISHKGDLVLYEASDLHFKKKKKKRSIFAIWLCYSYLVLVSVCCLLAPRHYAFANGFSDRDRGQCEWVAPTVCIFLCFFILATWMRRGSLFPHSHTARFCCETFTIHCPFFCLLLRLFSLSSVLLLVSDDGQTAYLARDEVWNSVPWMRVKKNNKIILLLWIMKMFAISERCVRIVHALVALVPCNLPISIQIIHYTFRGATNAEYVFINSHSKWGKAKYTKGIMRSVYRSCMFMFIDFWIECSHW